MIFVFVVLVLITFAGVCMMMENNFPLWTPLALAVGAIMALIIPLYAGEQLDFYVVLEESNEPASLDSCSENVDDPVYFTKIDSLFMAYAVNVKKVRGCERKELPHNPLKLLGFTNKENLVVTRKIGAEPVLRIFSSKFKNKYHWLIAFPPFPETQYELVLPAE